MNNIKTICNEMERSVKDDIPLNPTWWINQATKLHILFSPVYKKYFLLMKQVAIEKSKYLQDVGMTSAKAKALTEAMPEYWEAQELKNQKKYVDDLIMLAKKMATMGSDELKGY